MTAPDHLVISGPQDILGFIPHSLGYWPESSLVAITMHGNRLGATLRLDLPGPRVLAAPAKYIRMVRGYLDADKEADGSLLAFFTGNAAGAAAATYGLLLAALDSALQTTVPVREAWYVGADYWREAYCIDPSCCPPQGRPLQMILDSAVNAEMVYRGSSVGPAPGRKPRAAPPVNSLYRKAVQESEVSWSEVLDGQRNSRAQLRAILAAWEALLGRPDGGAWLPEVERDGFLRATLLVPAWRDALLVMAAAGKHAAEAGANQFGILHDGDGFHVVPPLVACRARDSASTPQEETAQEESAQEESAPEETAQEEGARDTVPRYGDVLMGSGPAVPDWSRLNALDLVLEQLALPGGPAAAASLTLRGWISWCRGRGSYAAAYLSEALAIEPGYRLAELLLEIVGRGVICGWAGRKEAAWQKF
ncbi:DUF4192 family protein [Arthrobacter sp. AD-310]